MHRRTRAERFGSGTVFRASAVMSDVIRLDFALHQHAAKSLMRNVNPYSAPVNVAASIPEPDEKRLNSRTYWCVTLLAVAISPAIFVICECFDSVLGFYALNLIFWPPVIVGLVVSFLLLVNADSVPKRVASSVALLVNFGVALATLLLTLMFSGLRPA